MKKETIIKYINNHDNDETLKKNKDNHISNHKNTE